MNLKIRTMTLRKIILLFLFFTLLSNSIYSDILSEAKKLEDTGNIKDALIKYNTWLEENKRDKNYSAVFFHMLSLEKDPKKIIDLIMKNIPGITAASERHKAVTLLASLEETLGLIEDAQKHYQLASTLLPNSRDYKSLFISAALLFETGEFQRASEQAASIMLECPVSEIRMDAQLLLGKLYLKQNDVNKVTEIITSALQGENRQKFSPAQLLAIYELSNAVGNREYSLFAVEELKSRFPGSPEYALARKENNVEIEYYPNPSFYLEVTEAPEASTQATIKYLSIQTGSFLVRENAEYMVKDLKTADFNAEIIEKVLNNKIYYKVIIRNILMDDSQTTLMRLKDTGFEGFLLYD
ncbi:MAG: hypothetical protein AB1798_12090 [Spirochaetota bacterium]